MALPTSTPGICVGDVTVRVVAGLLLGAVLRRPHTCHCVVVSRGISMQPVVLAAGRVKDVVLPQ